MRDYTKEELAEIIKRYEEARAGLVDELDRRATTMESRHTEEITYTQPAKVKITHTTKGDTWEVTCRSESMDKALELSVEAYSEIEAQLVGRVDKETALKELSTKDMALELQGRGCTIIGAGLGDEEGT